MNDVGWTRHYYMEAAKHYKRRGVPFNVWPRDVAFIRVEDLPELEPPVIPGRLFCMKSKFHWSDIVVGNSYYIKKGSEEVWEVEAKQ